MMKHVFLRYWALCLLALTVAIGAPAGDKVLVGVAWQPGWLFNGPWSIRMNLALPLQKVQEAFNRLKQYVFRT